MTYSVKDVVIEKAKVSLERKLRAKYHGGSCLPWWSVAKASDLRLPFLYKEFREEYLSFIKLLGNKPIFESRQWLVDSVVVTPSGELYFLPEMHSHGRTLAGSSHPDDPYYDGNAVSGVAVIGGMTIHSFGGNTKRQFSLDGQDEPYATLDLSDMTIPDFESFFAGGRFAHPTFDEKEFSKEFYALLGGCCTVSLRAPTAHQGENLLRSKRFSFNRMVVRNGMGKNLDNRFDIYRIEHLAVGSIIRSLRGRESVYVTDLSIGDIEVIGDDDTVKGLERGLVITVKPYVANLKNLHQLSEYIAKEPQLDELVDVLFKMRVSGYDSGTLALLIYTEFVANHDCTLLQKYKDELEELCAALEGNCSSEYILHPNQYF
ncbi:hypothetical protein VCHA53O466_50310 [Vibrio chagasii]|nr:hypothetical protein VCHA53O466_50310 [Vibrio chagasii]